MEFGPVEKKDKGARRVVLRTLEVKDEGTLIRFQAQASLDSEFFPWAPGRTDLAADNARDYIERFAGAEREMLLGVFEDGELVALTELASLGTWPFFQHRCSAALGILKSHWGRGLGSILTSTVSEIARSVGYDQIEGSIDVLNERSYSRCLSIGYEDCGYLPHAEKREDGTYRDYHRMVKKM